MVGVFLGRKDWNALTRLDHIERCFRVFKEIETERFGSHISGINEEPKTLFEIFGGRHGQSVETGNNKGCDDHDTG
jgi:hypothetical protein